MNYIILIIAMTLSFILGAFLCLKSLQFGLRWKIQVENKQAPTINNPITEIIKAKEDVSQQRYTSEQLSEYFHGKDGDF